MGCVVWAAALCKLGLLSEKPTISSPPPDFSLPPGHVVKLQNLKSLFLDQIQQTFIIFSDV